MQFNFNDILAILIGVLVIPLIWAGQGLGYFKLPGEVIGSTIAIETLIAQYYWRKKPLS